HAEKHPVVTRERDRGGDVVSRSRLEDERGEPGRHAIPDRDGLVPTLVAGHHEPALDTRIEVLQLLAGQLVVSAVQSRQPDGTGGHVATPLRSDPLPSVPHDIYSKRQ